MTSISDCQQQHLCELSTANPEINEPTRACLSTHKSHNNEYNNHQSKAFETNLTNRADAANAVSHIQVADTLSNHVDVTAQIQIANTYNPLPKPNTTQQDLTDTFGGEQSIQQNVPFDLPLNMSVTDINSVFHDNQDTNASHLQPNAASMYRSEDLHVVPFFIHSGCC